MSIILDALRKSEAARRRNEAPELFATMPSAAEPARMPPRWPFWTIGTVGTVGIASLALAVWLTTRNEAPSVGDVATASTPALSTYDPSETDTAANVSEDRQAPFPSDAPIPLPANATATTAATRNDIETLAPPPSPATSTPAIEIGPPAAPLAVPSAPQGPNPNGDQRMATEPSSASIVAPPSRTAMAIPSAPGAAPAPISAPGSSSSPSPSASCRESRGRNSGPRYVSQPTQQCATRNR
jgi:general secretion pathway protein B